MSTPNSNLLSSFPLTTPGKVYPYISRHPKAISYPSSPSLVSSLSTASLWRLTWYRQRMGTSWPYIASPTAGMVLAGGRTRSNREHQSWCTMAFYPPPPAGSWVPLRRLLVRVFYIFPHLITAFMPTKPHSEPLVNKFLVLWEWYVFVWLINVIIM